jgi:ABC-2 type transport system permease protein
MNRSAVTLLRREIWEHPALYIAPLVVLSLCLVGVIGKIRYLGGFVQDHGAENVGLILDFGVTGFVVPFLMVLLVITPMYLLDCLYSERKDRSILFWKSMPVSDTSTVLSKLAVAMLLAPLLVYVAATATQVVSFLVGHIAIALSSDDGPSLLRSAAALVNAQAVLVYTLLAVSLWYAPVYGWLLMVSVWARRVPFLWATLVPVVLIVLEAEILRSRHFLDWIGYRFAGVYRTGYEVPLWIQNGDHDAFFNSAPATVDLLAPGQLLASMGLWSGLALAAAFTAGAILLRRYRDDA